MSLLQIHVPVYNEEHTLAQCIEDILHQSFTDFTLIIHDNCSSDKTISICKQYALKDKRILINEGKFNIGQILQFNKFQVNFDAKYVSLRSSNDRIHRDYFLSTVNLLENNNSLALAYSHGNLFFDNLSSTIPNDESCRINTLNKNIFESYLEVVTKYTNSFPLWGVYRRTIFEKCRSYPFRYGGDHIFIAEVSLYGAITSTHDTLDFRKETSADWREVMNSRAIFQSEESLKSIDKSSFFYSLKYKHPFVDMTWGHIEMLSLSHLLDTEKNSLIDITIDVLKNRFGLLMHYEIINFLNFIELNLSFLESNKSIMEPSTLLWLLKLREELAKIKILKIFTFDEIDYYENRIQLLLKHKFS